MEQGIFVDNNIFIFYLYYLVSSYFPFFESLKLKSSLLKC